MAGTILLQLFQSLRLRFVPGCRLRPQFSCVLHVPLVVALSELFPSAPGCHLRAQFCCVLHMTAVHRIVSVFRYIVFCKGVPRQSHCNCNENGVHVSLFLLLTAFIFLLNI